MGLFGFLKKEPVKPLEEYLMQWPEERLMSLAIRGLKVRMPKPDETYLPPLWVKMSTLPGRDRNIPNCYSRTEVSSQKLLELANDKGHVDAPFYLAMMHEYGMVEAALGDSIKGDALLSYRNQPLADSYHQIARERGSQMEVAYQCMKEDYHWKENIYDEKDNMISLLTHLDEGTPPANILGDLPTYKWFGSGLDIDNANDADRYTILGGILMAFYAGKGFPKCMAGYAAYLNLYGSLQRDSNMLFHKMIPETQMHILNGLVTPYGADVMLSGSLRLRNELFQRAAQGDMRAAAAIQQYELNNLE